MLTRYAEGGGADGGDDGGGGGDVRPGGGGGGGGGGSGYLAVWGAGQDPYYAPFPPVYHQSSRLEINHTTRRGSEVADSSSPP